MTKFSAKSTHLGAAIVVAAGLLAAPASANFIGVSLCNESNTATHSPVLHIVDGGDRYIIAPGQGGLTTSTIMSERDALQWASASGLFPPGTVFGNYSGYICGMQRGEEPSQPQEETPVASEPPTDECSLCGEEAS